MELPMAERDTSWTEYIRQNVESCERTLMRLKHLVRAINSYLTSVKTSTSLGRAHYVVAYLNRAGFTR